MGPAALGGRTSRLKTSWQAIRSIVDAPLFIVQSQRSRDVVCVCVNGGELMLMTVLGIGVSCAHLFQLPPATSSPAYSARVLRGLFQNRRPSLETPHYCRMLDN